MTKETLAIFGLGLTIVAAVFGFGIRIGSLTTQVEAQTKQMELLSQDLRAINSHFVQWTSRHAD